jgi:hypothetical protein
MVHPGFGNIAMARLNDLSLVVSFLEDVCDQTQRYTQDYPQKADTNADGVKTVAAWAKDHVKRAVEQEGQSV